MTSNQRRAVRRAVEVLTDYEFDNGSLLVICNVQHPNSAQLAHAAVRLAQLRQGCTWSTPVVSDATAYAKSLL